LEHGDPGASAAHYLSALWVLGVMDMVTQAPPGAVMDAIHNRRRARPFDKDDDF